LLLIHLADSHFAISPSPTLPLWFHWPPAGKVDAFNQKELRVFVAASLECFPDLSPQEGLEALADLEYSAVEIPIHESGRGLKPSDVHADIERASRFCRDTHRLDIAALDIELAPGPDYYAHFTACCKLAKAIKVVS